MRTVEHYNPKRIDQIFKKEAASTINYRCLIRFSFVMIDLIEWFISVKMSFD